MQTLDFLSRCNVEGTFHAVFRHADGRVFKELTLRNTKTDAGKAERANLLIGAGTEPTHIAIGTGTPSATALGTELDRQAAAATRVTTTVTDDTAQYLYKFEFDATHSVTEAGLLNAAADGIMYCSQVFTAVPVYNNDTMEITWKLRNT